MYTTLRKWAPFLISTMAISGIRFTTIGCWLSSVVAQKETRGFGFRPKFNWPKNHEMITVIHFYFGADLISVISVQGIFTEIKSLPKFQLRVDGCSCLFKIVWIPLALPKFSPYQNGEFSLYRILYVTEIKVDYSSHKTTGSFSLLRAAVLALRYWPSSKSWQFKGKSWQFKEGLLFSG